MHKTLLQALILNALVCFTSFAQSIIKIDGFARSEEGEPLAGAHIIVAGTAIRTTTDLKGYFKIENLFAGDYHIEASHIGYQTAVKRNITVRKDGTRRVDFRLKSKTILLKGVLVEALRDEGYRSSFVEEIDSDEIRRSAAESLGDLLGQVPGVSIATGGSGGKKTISIRGSNASQVLVVLDGLPLNDALTGEVDLRQISLAAIENVKIYKGGDSSQFGSGALGGVVEITSKEHAVDEVRLGSALGDFGSRSFRPSASGTFKEVHYFFSADWHAEDGDFPFTYERLDGTTVQDVRNNANFASQNYFARISGDFRKTVLQVQSNIYRSERSLPGLIFALSPWAQATNKRQIYAAFLKQQRSRFYSEVRLTRRIDETVFLNEIPADAPLRFRSAPSYHSRYKITGTQVDGKLTRPFGADQKIEVFASLKRDAFRDENLRPAQPKQMIRVQNVNRAAGIRGDWQLPGFLIFERTQINTSVRFDRAKLSDAEITRDESTTSPRLGLMLAGHKKYGLTVKANWGKSFRMPTFSDLFFQDLRVKGNAELLPERSIDFDAGLEWTVPAPGTLLLSGTWFHHTVQNLISWELGSFATWQPFNTDALLKGWEFGSAWRVWQDRIYLNASHVYLDARDKSGRRTTHNRRLIYRPERTTKVAFRMKLKKMNLDYQKRVVGERFETQANTVALPKYTVDDLTLSTTFQLRSIELTATISGHNILNKNYVVVERAPLPGRNWRARIDIVF